MLVVDLCLFHFLAPCLHDVVQGFAMLESAYGEKMNAANVMMKNVVDLLVGAIAYYFFGHWLAYGHDQQCLNMA